MASWYSGTLTEEECRRHGAYITGWEDFQHGVRRPNPYYTGNVPDTGDSPQMLYCYGYWAACKIDHRTFGPPLYDLPGPAQLSLFED